MKEVEKTVVELASEKYEKSRKAGMRTAWITLLLSILGFVLSIGKPGNEATFSGGLIFLSLVTTVMLFVANYEMKKYSLKASLKKQARICQSHYSLTLGYLAFVSITGLSQSTQGAIIALLVMTAVVTPLYFISNTAIDFAEEC